MYSFETFTLKAFVSSSVKFCTPYRNGSASFLTQSCVVLVSFSCLPDSFFPWNSPGQNTSMCSHSLLLGIFLTQGSNPGLLHCRQILYRMNHQQAHFLILLSVSFTSSSLFCSCLSLPVLTRQIATTNPSLRYMPLQPPFTHLSAAYPSQFLPSNTPATSLPPHSRVLAHAVLPAP